LHSANKGFRDEKVVTLEDFIEYHAIVNTQIERDQEFKNFIVGVWNMDVIEEMDQKVTRTQYTDPRIAGKKAIAFPAKNSNIAWKHDFHRSQFGAESIITHQVPDEEDK